MSKTFDFLTDSGLTVTGQKAGYSNATPSPEFIVGQVIQLVLGFLGIVFLAFMIYAGVTWMTAQGNEQKVEKAKQMITESIIGLIIVVIAYAVVAFIISYFADKAIVA